VYLSLFSFFSAFKVSLNASGVTSNFGPPCKKIIQGPLSFFLPFTFPPSLLHILFPPVFFLFSCPFLLQVGPLDADKSSGGAPCRHELPQRVRGGAPAKNVFRAFWCPRNRICLHQISGWVAFRLIAFRLIPFCLIFFDRQTNNDLLCRFLLL